MKRLDLSTLQLVVLIADSGSLTAAARRASLTLAAVSKRLLDLEQRFGVMLFERRASGTVPTEAGRALIAHARQMLFDFERMQAEMSAFGEGRSGTVRLGANASAMTQFLPEDLSAFAARRPAIRIDLTELTSEAIVMRLIDGRLELGIFSSTVAHLQIRAVAYRSDRLCIVVRSGTKLARRRKIAFAELRGEPVVGLEPGSSLVQLLHEHADGPFAMPVQARSFDVACRFVQAGLGVAVMPEGTARLYSTAMGLAILALDEPWAHRELLLGSCSDDTLSAPARLLFDELSEASTTG
ncbi:MAG TPA: LysR substrate-binding domain-containing protein [Burkholderiaceae bacterium]|nr:LysR substrate-binding domain-containing protein [Burkholderiaceae bacterium]